MPMARRMLIFTDVFETLIGQRRLRRQDRSPDRRRLPSARSRSQITSKRRSPWLCPAPSGGAGLFLLTPYHKRVTEKPKSRGHQKGTHSWASRIGCEDFAQIATDFHRFRSTNRHLPIHILSQAPPSPHQSPSDGCAVQVRCAFHPGERAAPSRQGPGRLSRLLKNKLYLHNNSCCIYNKTLLRSGY